MPSASTIITKARRFANITGGAGTGDYPDATAVSDLNDGKNDFWSAIVSTSNQDYGWQYWTADTVNLQSEYSLPPESASLAGGKKIKNVYVNYDGVTYPTTGKLAFRKAKLVDPGSLENSWEYYEKYQSPETPIYRVADKSVFIAPVPGADVGNTAGTGRIVMSGIRKVPDWTITTTEDDISAYIPVDQQQALIHWLCWNIDLTKRQPQEAAQDRAEYDKIKNEYVTKLAQRVETPFESSYPDERAEQAGYSPFPTN
jgi:hypothetical protein